MSAEHRQRLLDELDRQRAEAERLRLDALVSAGTEAIRADILANIERLGMELDRLDDRERDRRRCDGCDEAEAADRPLARYRVEYVPRFGGGSSEPLYCEGCAHLARGNWSNTIRRITPLALALLLFVGACAEPIAPETTRAVVERCEAGAAAGITLPGCYGPYGEPYR